MLAAPGKRVDYLAGNGGPEARWYRPAMTPSTSTAPVGALLREWRQRRRLTQMDLALDAAISPRHLSFVETGRAQPSREMLLHLAEELDVPLRERNRLLTAAGFAPMFRERPLDDAALAAAREAIDVILAAQKPWPAFAVDRHWNIVATNHAMPQLYEGIAAELLAPPMNALRLALHPRGLAPRIENLSEWRAHLLARLRKQVDASQDEGLAALQAELQAYEYPGVDLRAAAAPDHVVMVPLRVRSGDQVLSFFTTITVFGTPVDVTLSELAIELFFPADARSAAAARGL